MKKLAALTVWLGVFFFSFGGASSLAASWSDTNNPGEYKEYSFAIGAGDTDLTLIVPDVGGVSSQIILKQGSAPVDNNDFDFSSSAGTNEQVLSISTPSLAADTWYARVITDAGASGPHAFTLYQDVNEAATPSALALKFAQSDVDLNLNQWDYYRIVTPASPQGLRIVMSTEDQGASGCAGNCPKADLYLRQGSPTGTDLATGLNGTLTTLTLDTASTPANTPLYIAVKADANLRYNLYVDDKFMRYLTWDDGSTLAGSSNKTHPDLQGGSYFYRITSQSVATNAWRTALKVNSGEAAVFLNKDLIPYTGGTYSSENPGSDGFVLDESKFADAQTWYIRVDAQPGTSWSLLSGAVFVNDLGNLADYNSTASSASDIEVGPEGMSFFKTQVGAGTKAWRLHLNADTYPIYVDKDEVPLNSSAAHYDKSELVTGQMLLVPTYLTSGTYYVSVVADPETVFSFDSRKQQIRTPSSEAGYSGVDEFDFALSGANDGDYGFLTYQIQVPVDELGWQVTATPTSGDVDVYVRQGEVPNVYNNTALSEVVGSVIDSTTVVPPALSDGTWYITLVGQGSFTFDLRSRDPVVTDIAFFNDPTPVTNDLVNKAGWRYYRVGSGIIDTLEQQLGIWGWQLELQNQVAGSNLAIRRNAVPGEWQYRQNGDTNISTSTYVDYESVTGLLDRNPHEADVWYVGVYSPDAALGAFDLYTRELVPTITDLAMNGGTSSVTGQLAGDWRFFRVVVPEFTSEPNLLGWHLALTGVTGDPEMVIKKTSIPLTLGSSGLGFKTFTNGELWEDGDSWRPLSSWDAARVNDDLGVDQRGRFMTAGVNNPLTPGIYYIGITNGSGTDTMSYTITSDAIGTGTDSGSTPWTRLVSDITLNGGVVNGVGLAPRDFDAYRLVVPADTHQSWRLLLQATGSGEGAIALQKDLFPNDLDDPQSGFKRNKDGDDYYYQFHEKDLLDPAVDTYLEAGTYYLTVIGEGQNPASSSVMGAGTIDYTLTSVVDLQPDDKTATVVTSATPVSWLSETLAFGEYKTYRFKVSALNSYEIELKNPTGDPDLCVIAVDPLKLKIPDPEWDKLTFATTTGYNDWRANADVDGGYYTVCSDTLITATMPEGEYIALVGAGREDGINDIAFDLVVTGFDEVVLPFNGGEPGAISVVDQPAGHWRFFRVDVPADANLDGWHLRLDNVTSGDPEFSVTRDYMPFSLKMESSTFYKATSWEYQWHPDYSWSNTRKQDSNGDDTSGRYLTLGLGNPLQAGTYYIGVTNATVSGDPLSYRLVSSGIGTGNDSGATPWVYQVQDLAFEGGSYSDSGLSPREAHFFRVAVPANTESWEFKLDPGAGGDEVGFAVQQEAVPRDYVHKDAGFKRSKDGYEYYYQFSQGDSADPHYQFLEEGDYFVAVYGEGVNPTAAAMGSGTVSYTITSLGEVDENDASASPLDIASPQVWASQSLEYGEFASYRFRVVDDLSSIEIEMQNIVAGDPDFCVVSVASGETHLPEIANANGVFAGSSSLNDWRKGVEPVGGYDDNYGLVGCSGDILTIQEPTGEYLVLVGAGFDLGVVDITFDLVVTAFDVVELPLLGGEEGVPPVGDPCLDGAVVTDQDPSTWRYFTFEIPEDETLLGVDVRLSCVSGDPEMVIGRELLPGVLDMNPPTLSDSEQTWQVGDTWHSESEWDGARNLDVTMRDQSGQVSVLGVGNPLSPGVYYIGVTNSDSAALMSYTINARGIGIGTGVLGQPWPLQVQDLAYDGGVANGSGLSPREADFYRVEIPAGQESWHLTLQPSSGDEVALAVQKDVLPNGFDDPDSGFKRSKQGNDYLYIFNSGNAADNNYRFVEPGTYYLAVVGEGASPGVSNMGAGEVAYTLTTQGEMAVSDQTASPLQSGSPVSWLSQGLAYGQFRLHRFALGAGVASFEIQLLNTAGDPDFCVIPALPGETPIPAILSASGIFANTSGKNDWWYDARPLNGYTTAYGNLGCVDNIYTHFHPVEQEYLVLVGAGFDLGATDVSYDLVVEAKSFEALAFDGGTDTESLIDQQYKVYEVTVPDTFNSQPLIGWSLELATTAGTATLYASKDKVDLTLFSSSDPQSVLAAPYLEPGTWYVTVSASGVTDFQITSNAIVAEREWVMPAPGETFTAAGLSSPDFGDSGIDDSGNPIINPVTLDQGTDLEDGYFHYYRITVPENNAGLLRTEVQALNGDPEIYIREAGIPTLTHRDTGQNGNMFDRRDTGDVTHYGNWVPFELDDGNVHLPAGDWWIGIYANGSNVLYRLTVSAGAVTTGAFDSGTALQDSQGYVQDLLMDGGSYTGDVLAKGDWRYYRVAVPESSTTLASSTPLDWDLTITPLFGAVRVDIRDTVPPGLGAIFTETSATNIQNWADDHNKAAYTYAEVVSGSVSLTTPPVKPGKTYFVGVHATSDATYDIASTIGVDRLVLDGVIDFEAGSINIVVPTGEERLYRIDVPSNGSSWHHTATHSNDLKLYLQQGTKPPTPPSTKALWYSNAANDAHDISLYASTTDYWVPGESYYLLVDNPSAGPQSLIFTMAGELIDTDDYDNDGLPDQWEVDNFGTISQSGTGDFDGDGVTNLDEYTNATDPANTDSDNDGMDDGFEIANGLNPLADDSLGDPDSDGLSNLDEYLLGTNPVNNDSDGDGLLDNVEIVTHGTDPSVADSDNDLMDDGWEVTYGFDPLDADDAYLDLDGDGFANYEEYRNATLPNDNASVIAAGNILWMFETGTTNADFHSTPAIGIDGSVYAGASDFYAYAFSRFGEIAWTQLPYTGSAIDLASFAVAANGDVYVGSQSFRLNAFDSNGAWLWGFITDGAMDDASPAIAADGTIYVADALGMLYAINPDGSEKWRFNLGAASGSGGISIAADGTLYVPVSGLPALLSITDTGVSASLNWSYKVKLGLNTTPAIGADGVIYIGADDDALHAVYPDGRQQWVFATGGDVASSPLVDADGTIYVGSDDNKYYAINPDGSQLWSYTGSNDFTSSGVLGDDGIVYVGNLDGSVYALNTADGTLAWSLALNDDVLGSPVIDNFGRLFVGTTANAFYAISVSSALKPAPWGIRGRDVSRTGRYQIVDSDADLMDDYWELRYGLNTSIDDSQLDADVDGLDNLDEYLNGSNPLVTDTDGDGLGDNDEVVAHGSKAYLSDTDNDTMPDGWELSNGFNLLDAADADLDADSDGHSNAEEYRNAVDPYDNAVRVGSGAALWTYEIGLNISKTAAIADDGTLYVASLTNQLDAFSRYGKKLWSYDLGDDASYGTITLADDGTIYVGAKNKKMFAINPDGSLKWEYLTSGDLQYASVALALDGTLYFSDASGTLYALNADGTLRWTYSLGATANLWASPSVGDDGTIYVGSSNGHLLSLTDNVASAALNWDYNAGDKIRSMPTIARDGTIYVGTWDTNLHAVNPDGSQKWLYPTGGDIYASPSLANDGTIYVGSLDNSVHAINPDGSQLWTYATGGDVYSSVFVAEDGMLYVGSNDNNLYALNTDGTLAWSYTAADDVIASPVMDADGRIYVGSKDGLFHAVASSSAGAMYTPWPMHGHDNKHTARDNTIDTDGDGIDDVIDTDDDDDGMPDTFEITYGLDPLDSSDASGDPDGDGLTNYQEYQYGSSPISTDGDADGLPDVWEINGGLDPLDASDATGDADGDLLSNADEYAQGTNPAVADSDGDGSPDGWEVQIGSNPLVANTDSDGDGIANYYETNVYGTNAFNPDTDADGLNDGDELFVHGSDPLLTDTDGDTLSDSAEVAAGTDPANADTDGDTMPDGWELANGLDPLNPADGGATDNDSDGRTNVQEYTDGTDPNNADTDGDGSPDGWEAQIGSDPLVANTDSDGDGIANYYETNVYGTNAFNADSDGDTLNDGDELFVHGTDPTLADTDGDNINDNVELVNGTDPTLADTDGDTYNDDVDAFPLDISEWLDTDGDTIGNNADPDDDNDGVSDVDEIACSTDPLDALDFLCLPSAGESDFDNDKDDDLLLRSTSTGAFDLVTVQSGAVSGSATLAIPATWTGSNWVHQGNIDLDGDMDKDILLKNTSTGAWRQVIMQDGAYVSNAALWMDSGNTYDFVAAGDFDADGDEDILLRNSSLGTYQLNEIQAAAVIDKRNLPLWTGDYVVQIVGDFDGDQDDDILMRRTSTGKYRRFAIEAGALAGSAGLTSLYTSSDYTLQGVGDLDADGDEDIILRSTSSGAWRVFVMQNNLDQSDTPFSPYASTAWVFQTEGDFDGDGDTDILLRNSSTGAWRVFTVEAGAVTGNAAFGASTNLDLSTQY